MDVPGQGDGIESDPLGGQRLLPIRGECRGGQDPLVGRLGGVILLVDPAPDPMFVEQLADGRFIAIADDGRVALERRGLWFGRFVTGGRRLFRISSAN